MTIVGKIMIVLILVMSILFMGFTVANYSTHQNWKGRAEALATERNDLTRDKAELQSQIEVAKNKLAMEMASRREAIALLETRATLARQERLASENKLAELQTQHGQALTTLETYQTNLKSLKDEVALLRESIRKSQQERDQAFIAANKLTDDLNQGEGDMRRLRERYQQLMGQFEKVSLVLDRNNLDEFSPVDHIPPNVNGEVTHVRDSSVEISIGSDEGLRAGHTLKVFRIDSTGEFLAIVEVIETGTDRAVARVIPETREGRIRKGDYVATKIL